MNERRVAQPILRRDVKRIRRAIAESLRATHGIAIAQSIGTIGFMVNRAPLPAVARAMIDAQSDPDPLAKALELLARRQNA